MIGQQGRHKLVQYVLQVEKFCNSGFRSLSCVLLASIHGQKTDSQSVSSISFWHISILLWASLQRPRGLKQVQKPVCQGCSSVLGTPRALIRCARSFDERLLSPHGLCFSIFLIYLNGQSPIAYFLFREHTSSQTEQHNCL